MPHPSAAIGDAPTAKQRARREEIVETAAGVLANRGLAACTAREIAEAGGLTRSVIHYYFADLETLVDAAMARLVGRFAADLVASGAEEPDATAAFWAVLDRYLTTFRERPEVTRLWLEYWADASRHGRDGEVARLNRLVVDVLAERLRAAGAPTPDRAAATTFRYLLGALLGSDPDTDRELRHDVGALTGVRRPD